MGGIDEIIEFSAEKIKKLLVEEAKKLKIFPTMLFGVEDSAAVKKYGTSGIAQRNPGMLVSQNILKGDNSVIVMLPDGLLYNFGCAYFIEINNEKVDGSKPFPDFETKREVSAKEYNLYGKQAHNELREKLL